MGEEKAVTEGTEPVENGSVPLVKEGESVSEKKDEEKGGVEEMEEDDKTVEKGEASKMDVEEKEDKDVNEGISKAESELKESKVKEDDEKVEEPEKEVEPGKEEEQEKEESEKKEDTESKPMEEDTETKVNDEDKGENAVGPDEEDEKPEKVAKGKVTKEHGRAKTAKEKVSNKKAVEEKKDKEPKTPKTPVTPATPAIERPIRERKSVERLVATIEKDTAREFFIEKGPGTALKDIPNVAFKLAKKKSEELCKLLHTILYGRRGKASQVKSNVSRFSGFVWHENEDKQKIKVREKFDKCVKEKLLEICELLDLPITKTTSRKEDIVAKLVDFLVAPHATTTELLAEKEQSSKGQKRKRSSKPSGSTSGSMPSGSSAKSRKKNKSASKREEEKSKPVSDEESEEEKEYEDDENEEHVNGVSEGSEDEKPEPTKNEEKGTESEAESEEDLKKHKPSKKSSEKKNSTPKTKTKKITMLKKSSPPKKAPSKPSSSQSKLKDNDDTSPKTFSRKKKTEVVKEKSSTPKKSASKEKGGKKVVQGKEKPKEEKVKSPSDDELRNAICEILKEVDFNTATFTDILKQLVKQFNTDLTPRKSSIKLMIQDELTKLADEADEDEEEGDGVTDEKQHSGPAVKA